MRKGSIKFTSNKALNVKANENEGKKSIWKPNNYCFLTVVVINRRSIICTKWSINTLLLCQAIRFVACFLMGNDSACPHLCHSAHN